MKRKKDRISYAQLTKVERVRYEQLRRLEKEENILNANTKQKQEPNDDGYYIPIFMYAISLVLAWAISTYGNFDFDWSLVIFVPFYAAWLMLGWVWGGFRGYIFWILIQWFIFYFQIGPPDWMRASGGKFDF